MNAAAHPQALEAPADTLHALEGELTAARRVPGALRAVHCLTFPWTTAEDVDTRCVRREDLGFLFEVIAIAAEQHLNQLDGIAARLARHQRWPETANPPGSTSAARQQN